MLGAVLVKAQCCPNPRYIRASASSRVAVVASEVALLILDERPADPDIFGLGFVSNFSKAENQFT